MRFAQVLLLLGFAISPALAKKIAMDAIEPVQVCERFLESDLKQKCLKLQKSPSADAYVAKFCDEMEGDQEFFNCLELGSKLSFSPENLADCSKNANQDVDQLQCLEKLAAKKSEEKNRLPASNQRRKNHRISR